MFFFSCRLKIDGLNIKKKALIQNLKEKTEMF